jgi:hypothetical protein
LKKNLVTLSQYPEKVCYVPSLEKEDLLGEGEQVWSEKPRSGSSLQLGLTLKSEHLRHIP